MCSSMSIVLCQWHSFKTNKSASLDEDLGFIEVKQFVKLKMIKSLVQWSYLTSEGGNNRKHIIILKILSNNGGNIEWVVIKHSVKSSSVAQSCPTLCYPMNRSTPGLPVYHQLPEFTQTHVHWIGDAIQLTHPLASPSPPAPNLSQHQSLFQWVNSLH